MCTYRFEQEPNRARADGLDRKDRTVEINKGLCRRSAMAQLMAE